MTSCLKHAVAIVSALMLLAMPVRADPRLKEMQREIRRLHGYTEPPPLTVEVSESSPDAAGRYMWLVKHVPADITAVQGWLDPEEHAIYADESHTLTVEQVDQIFKANQAWFDAFEAASKLPTADFCLDSSTRSLGYGQDDPRSTVLGPLRRANRILLFEIGRRWNANDFAGACELLNATLQFAKHCGDQKGTLLDELVTEALLKLTLNNLDRWFDRGLVLSPQQAMALGERLDSFDVSDPTGLKASAVRHRHEAIAFAKAALAPDSDLVDLQYDLMETRAIVHSSRALFGDIAKVIRGEEQFDFQVTWLEKLEAACHLLLEYLSLHPVNLRRTLTQCEAWSGKIDERWDSPDFQDWFKSTIRELPEDRTGLMTYSLVELTGTIYRTWQESRDLLAQVRERVRAMAQNDEKSK